MKFKKQNQLKLNKNDYCEATQELISLFKQFISEMRYSGKKREETIRGYICTFETFIKLCPEISCNTLNKITVNGFFEKLDNRERPVGKLTKSGGAIKIKTGIKNSTVATYRSKLNKFFDWLIKEKKLEINPFWYLEYPSVHYDDIKFLNKREIDRVFLALSTKIDWKNNFIEKRNMAIFSVLLNCGLRKNELINLRLDDIDFDNRYLIVRAETSKSKRERIVPLNSTVFTQVRKYMEERRKIESNEMNLFINEKGNKFSVNGLKHLVEKVKRVSGINCHLHRFRHTFAINFLTKSNNQFALKQLLGHKDLKMTQAYIKYIPTDVLRESVEKMNRLDNFL